MIKQKNDNRDTFRLKMISGKFISRQDKVMILAFLHLAARRSEVFHVK